MLTTGLRCAPDAARSRGSPPSPSAPGQRLRAAGSRPHRSPRRQPRRRPPRGRGGRCRLTRRPAGATRTRGWRSPLPMAQRRRTAPEQGRASLPHAIRALVVALLAQFAHRQCGARAPRWSALVAAKRAIPVALPRARAPSLSTSLALRVHSRRALALGSNVTHWRGRSSAAKDRLTRSELVQRCACEVSSS